MLLQLYSDCPDPSAAEQQAAALLASLARLLPHCPARLRTAPQRYWKIPEYFGFDLQLEGAGLAEYHQLIATCPGNWWLLDDEHSPEAVWNAGEGPPLLIAEARWAQLIPAQAD